MFFLNPNSGVPLYVQLHQQIRQQILSGQLPDKTPLPSVRELSADLHINPLTVAKVYQILERESVIETKHGIGSRVSFRSPLLNKDARRQQIGPTAEQLVTAALHLGLSEKEVVALVAEKFRQLNPKD